MLTKTVSIGAVTAIEIISDEVVIGNEQDALDLMSTISSDYIIIHEYNLENNFFDLSTRLAGKILQKFSNYHVKLAIIGNFEKYNSRILKDFMFESNKIGDCLFVNSTEEVAGIWRRGQ